MAENDTALAAAIGLALTRGGDPRTALQHSVQALVRHLNAGFAGIWLLDEAHRMLELRGSAGIAGGVDPSYRRVLVGTLTIGAIAHERQPHFAPAVEVDAPIGDPAWLRGERIVAFAGCPLMLESKLVGVMAVFARREFSATDKDALVAVAATVALAIDRKRAERAVECSPRAHTGAA